MKQLFLIFAVLTTLIACHTAPKTNPNEALVKQYFEYFNKHDWQKLANMYAETADFKDPTLGKGIVPQTRVQTAQKYGDLQKIFPDLKDSIVMMYPSGDKHIVVEFVSSGTAPDNSKFELPICTIFTIEKGLITKDFTYFESFEEK
jgi:ketosteroid isomerase-like protein